MSNELPQNLHILHRLKDAGGHGLAEPVTQQLQQQSLLIDTCLRQVWISAADHPTDIPDGIPTDTLTTALSGHQAYSFLLQTITGLNSSVPGETNVTGQFKCAWKRWRNTVTPAVSANIDILMNRLLTDSSQIRHQHLEGTGGSSYGSLVRKLLHTPNDLRILFVGAGKFSRSMLPFFSAHQTALWGHKLHKGLQPDKTSTQLFAPDETTAAASWADCLILTTPPDNEANEQLWCKLAQSHDINRIVHLGLRRAEPGLWKECTALQIHDLDDVFDLRSQQSDLRDERIAAARRACVQLAYKNAADLTFAGTPVLQRA
jgi:glutamyl-tRNA reductase